MNTLFGDRDGSAIEAGIDASSALSPTVWGHMGIWCRGAMLGDLENRFCAIGVARDRFRPLLAPVGGRLRVDCLWAERQQSLAHEAALIRITLDPQALRSDGVARAVSSDVRFGPPALRSLGGNIASSSWLRSVSDAARLARATPRSISGRELIRARFKWEPYHTVGRAAGSAAVPVTPFP